MAFSQTAKGRHGKSAEGNWDRQALETTTFCKKVLLWARRRKGRFGPRGVDGTGHNLCCLGSYEVGACGACGRKKRNWGCGMESGTWQAPCRYLADRGRCQHILAPAARGWKSLERSRKNFYLEHSPNARPTRQLSNHLIKSQLLRLPRPTCNLSPSSTNSLSHIKRGPYISSRFPFSLHRGFATLICTRHYDSVIPCNLFSPSQTTKNITTTPPSSSTTNNHHGSRCWY